jgi:hypothetical protein
MIDSNQMQTTRRDISLPPARSNEITEWISYKWETQSTDVQHVYSTYNNFEMASHCFQPNTTYSYRYNEILYSYDFDVLLPTHTKSV